MYPQNRRENIKISKTKRKTWQYQIADEKRLCRVTAPKTSQTKIFHKTRFSKLPQNQYHQKTNKIKRKFKMQLKHFQTNRINNKLKSLQAKHNWLARKIHILQEELLTITLNSAIDYVLHKSQDSNHPPDKT